MTLLRVGPLPDEALAAAAHFHARVVPEIAAIVRAAGEGAACVVLAFELADHAHRAWRLAAVQGLARAHAPVRVNGVASDDETAIAAALAYLADAPGVTGQYWPLDGRGAGSA